MAGIYVHIPYCKQICHYCDFYKIANYATTDEFIKAIFQEIDSKRSEFHDTIETIYFGGGTPSTISIENLKAIIDKLYENFTVKSNIEQTIEVNPDDITNDYLKGLKDLGFTRLSIGIQSFNDKILTFLNRRHDSKSAINAIELSLKNSFTNLSVDLIYGIPSQTVNDFIHDLELVNQYKIPHLSSYHLGIEPNTYFGKLKKHNRFREVDENMSKRFFNTLTSWARENGFEHYEVSNLAKNELYSKHNMNYWFHVPYISFGPSAHSFFQNKRFFNVSNIKKYIQKIVSGDIYYEVEQLKTNDLFNEFIMLRLRTIWGLDLSEVALKFGQTYYDHLLRIFLKFKDSSYIRKENDTIKLTSDGFFVSDFVVREFFII